VFPLPKWDLRGFDWLRYVHRLHRRNVPGHTRRVVVECLLQLCSRNVLSAGRKLVLDLPGGFLRRRVRNALVPRVCGGILLAIVGRERVHVLRRGHLPGEYGRGFVHPVRRRDVRGGNRNGGVVRLHRLQLGALSAACRGFGVRLVRRWNGVAVVRCRGF
jgi:hypothetical protein